MPLNVPQVEFPDGRRTLAMLPARFNKKLWVRRGGYLIIEEGVAEGAGAVSALIVSVLYVDGVRALRKLPGVWCARLTFLAVTGRVLLLSGLCCLRPSYANGGSLQTSGVFK